MQCNCFSWQKHTNIKKCFSFTRGINIMCKNYAQTGTCVFFVIALRLHFIVWQLFQAADEYSVAIEDMSIDLNTGVSDKSERVIATTPITYACFHDLVSGKKSINHDHVIKSRLITKYNNWCSGSKYAIWWENKSFLIDCICSMILNGCCVCISKRVWQFSSVATILTYEQKDKTLIANYPL